jgi:hypothetical protein
MFEYLVYGGPPWLFLLFTAIVSLGFIGFGYIVGQRFESNAPEKAAAAFGVAQASIFGVTTLILAFSFSYAASRFDGRRDLIVREANAIGSTYLEAADLQPANVARFRDLLRSYTQLRLQAYTYQPDLQRRVQSYKRSVAMQDALWDIASKAGRADPRNVQLALLKQALGNTFDVSGEQTSSWGGHMPDSMIALMLITTFASAFMLGVTFGGASARSISMAIAFSLLFAIVIFAIVDLDRPERGLANINLAPLQMQLESMPRSTR